MTTTRLAVAWHAALRLPHPLLLVPATIGAAVIATLAVLRWGQPGDEAAYWLGARRLIDGMPLYDLEATGVTPFAYQYPPILAQALVPVAIALPLEIYSWAYTALLLGCLWWLAGRNLWVALALVAFPPVAVELWFRNVHLILAVLLVAALRGRPEMFALGATIKVAPGLGLAYLGARGAWRSLLVGGGLGAMLLAASVAVSPSAWSEFIQVVVQRGLADESGLFSIAYYVRAAIGLLVVLVAGRLSSRFAGPLVVVGVTIAMPTLWVTALATLIAIVPLVRETWAAATASTETLA